MQTRTDELITQLRAIDRLIALQEPMLDSAADDPDGPSGLGPLSSAVAGDRASSRDALRRLGGVPDVATPALARLGRPVATAADSVRTRSETVLAGLAITHQIADRARLLDATAGSDRSVRTLGERILSHQDDIINVLREHITTLATDPTALGARPALGRAGLLPHIAAPALRATTGTVDRVAARLGSRKRHIAEDLGAVSAKVSGAAGAASEVVLSGRDAALGTAQHLASDGGHDDIADTVRSVRAEVGALSASELPIRRYDALTANEAAAAVRHLGDPADVDAVAAYELRTKKRSTVIRAVETHRSSLVGTGG
jgi:hypothetical protein